jgi:hypothetical protein
MEHTRRYYFLIVGINKYEICVISFAYRSFVLQIEPSRWGYAYQMHEPFEDNLIEP